MKPRVLAIAGSDRSGTTLLDTILGGYPDVFSAGEVWHLWNRGLRDGRLCGCGLPVNECPLWTKVVHRAWPQGIDWGVIGSGDSLLRSRHSFDPLLPGLGRRYFERLEPLARQVGPVYEAIAEVTGAGVIVDSSKRPTWMHLLSRVDGIELKILHMVRDPRAVAHSRHRYKRQVDDKVDRGMTQHAPVSTAVFWNIWNLAIEGISRSGIPFLRVRYEDLIESPVATTETIASFIGMSQSTHPTLRDDSVELSAGHTVSGNPTRFDTGRVRLQIDDSWKTDQSRLNRIAVTSVTAPVARRYGYPIGSGTPVPSTPRERT